MPDPTSRDKANQLIANAQAKISQATVIYEDLSRLAKLGPESKLSEITWVANLCFFWLGKQFTDTNPATIQDVRELAGNMRGAMDNALRAAAPLFEQIATVAVQYGQDPRPFTATTQMLALNLAGHLQPDPSKISPNQLFTVTAFEYSADLWEKRLRGADHPHDALLKLKTAINAPFPADPHVAGRLHAVSAYFAKRIEKVIWAAFSAAIVAGVLIYLGLKEVPKKSPEIPKSVPIVSAPK